MDSSSNYINCNMNARGRSFGYILVKLFTPIASYIKINYKIRCPDNYWDITTIIYNILLML